MSDAPGIAPPRWQGRERFVILDTAFGHGQRFLRWWQAWRDDAARCERLHVIALLPRSVTAQHIRSAHAASPQHALAQQLVQAWPVMTRNLHPLSFDDGRVQLDASRSAGAGHLRGDHYRDGQRDAGAERQRDHSDSSQ